MNLVIVDDNDNFRASIKVFLERKLNHKVLATFSNGESFLKSIPSLNPDIVLMDIAMPGLNGYQVTKKLDWDYGYNHILAVTMFTEEVYLQKLIEAGFRGCVYKSNVFIDLPKALATISIGEYYWPNELAEK